MVIERTKNAKRNIKIGLVNKIILIVLPFISRTIMIRTLGSEYLGLNSLFTSILQVLSLSELGFGSAVVYSLYKPIVEDDFKTISGLLNFYKKVYRIIGIVIMALGLILMPFLHLFISGNIPSDINIYVVFLIYLINTSVSYWLFSYKSVIPSALQREDINNTINTLTQVILNVVQITVLLLFHNYYIYVIWIPLLTIVKNILLAVKVKKDFPEFVEKGDISREEKNNIKSKIFGLMIGKVCDISRNSFDSIFVSMFLGLSLTAIYSNYYTILNGIVMLSLVIYSSILAGIGNKLVTSSVEDNYNDMRKMIFAYMWLAGWSSICLFCLYQPFMQLWMGKELMLDNTCVLLLSLYFYVLKIGDMRCAYSDALGLWWENRFRAVIEAISNIVLNYLLGRFFGIYGIILATIITLLVINFGYGSQILFNNYYKDGQKCRNYYFDHLKYFVVTVCIGGITYFICKSICLNPYLCLIVRGIVCLTVPNILYLLVYRNMSIYRDAMPWLLSKFRKISR